MTQLSLAEDQPKLVDVYWSTIPDFVIFEFDKPMLPTLPAASNIFFRYNNTRMLMRDPTWLSPLIMRYIANPTEPNAGPNSTSYIGSEMLFLDEDGMPAILWNGFVPRKTPP